MPRGEMLTRMDGAELSAWAALWAVQAEEADEAQDIRESGDGIVHRYRPDDGDDEDDGGTE